MKPSAKRKASRRVPAKRAKSTRRTSAAKSARQTPAKTAKVAPRVSAKRNKVAEAVAERVLSRPKVGMPILAPVAITVTSHRFRVGESVHLTAGVFVRGGANGIYKVTQLLPSDGDEQQYRIKSASEPHERVAKQSQLEPAL